VVEKLYSEYESQRLTKANEFMTGLIISKFASILGGLDAVESAEELSKELLADDLLRADVNILVKVISPHIPLIDLVSGGFTTAKHVVAHKFKSEEK
jgi:hypothetical protein